MGHMRVLCMDQPRPLHLLTISHVLFRLLFFSSLLVSCAEGLRPCTDCDIHCVSVRFFYPGPIMPTVT